VPPKQRRSRSPKKSDPSVGDQIKINNRGDRNANAAGRGAWAWVLNIDIRDLKWQPVVIILALVGTLLALILWFVIPRTSSTMAGQFNVAVAQFLVQDKNGKTVTGNDGALLATYLAQQIKTQFEGFELNKTLPYEIWGPEKVKPVKGKSVEERRIAAAALAEKIRAHVLVYGVIVADGDQSIFMPEFYINYKGFWQASEVTGSHQIGSQLRLTLPFNKSIPAIENPALAGRVNALNLITIGLAYYSVDDYQNAAHYFDQAVAEPRWLETSGKEVAYLLAGNAYISWASKDNDAQYLAQAQQNYADALRIKKDYGRGSVGLANVLYLESLGPLEQPEIDTAKLDEAESLTKRALALRDQAESANIPAKGHFNLGQISMARYQANVAGEDWLEKAKQEFTFVTREYEAGDSALETYAAHAYFRLGRIAYLQNEADMAVDLVKKSISLAPPFYKAAYSATLGDIYKNIGQKDLAAQAYEDAIAIAESMGDARKAQEYREKRDHLDQP
jgi:tetratricopeptide (TPR) repeat protein